MLFRHLSYGGRASYIEPDMTPLGFTLKTKGVLRHASVRQLITD
jgi:hypothetical protein